MKEHLAIRDFGPISEADIELHDLTIFVGPQATGKSLAAQALYFLRGLENTLSPSEDTPREALLSALRWWYGNDPSVYAGPGTSLRWDIGGPGKEAKQEIRWTQNGISLSEALKKRIIAWQKAGQEYYPKTQVYIPAGRTLYSFLTPSSALRIVSRTRPEQQWPGHIVTFYDLLDTTIKQLWQEQERGHRTLFDGTPENVFLRQRIELIIKGQIQYGPSTVLLAVKEKRLRPETIAAGQMEIWPFWAIVESGLKSGTFAPGSQIYFEEPEAHLHPGAQRNVMEMAAYLVRRGVRVLLITHSPYILYAVNNFLMAQKVLDTNRALPADVSSETALRSEQVAAYRFSSDGKAHDIMDVEVGLINEEELDQVADDLGATFARLQERLEGMA